MRFAAKTQHINTENDLGVYQIENTTPDVLSDLEFIQQENNSLLEHTDVLEIITQTDQNGQDIGSEQQEATTDPVEDTPTKLKT